MIIQSQLDAAYVSVMGQGHYMAAAIMVYLLPRIMIICVFTVSLPSWGHAAPLVAGWLENAWFDSSQIHFRAKLDTGAKTSSVNAPDFESFERNGVHWVRFRVVNSNGQSLMIERKVERIARVKRSGVAISERPVIRMKVCVAGETGDVDFTIADRTDMKFQVLIGRNFLADRILVDSGRTYLQSGRCRLQ